MESQEALESAPKEGRGRQGKSILIALKLSMSDYGSLSAAQVKMARRTGEDVSRERVVSEALQCLQKHGFSEE